MPYHVIRTIDGKRGGFLLVLAIAYLLIGLANICTPESRAIDLAFSWLPTAANANELGWGWIAAAAWMAAIALKSRRQPRCEKAGYIVAAVVPFVWAAIFCVSWLFGNPFGFRGGVIYLAIALAVAYVASWPNNVNLEARKD